MQLVTEQNSLELISKATGALHSLFSKYSAVPILFLTSGGSAFVLLDSIDTSSFNQQITISVLDERVSADPKINNFAQLKQTEFHKKVLEKQSQFINTEVESGEDVNSLALRFEQSLKQWKKENINGKIIATMGVGIDGHTSGILPFSEDETQFIHLFENPIQWVVGYDAGDKSPYRLRATTTITFLTQEVDHAIVYIKGEEKRQEIERVMNGSNLAEVPARVIKQMKDVTVFTDIKI